MTDAERLRMELDFVVSRCRIAGSADRAGGQSGEPVRRAATEHFRAALSFADFRVSAADEETLQGFVSGALDADALLAYFAPRIAAFGDARR